jgi:hypothetical protein
MTSNDSNLIKNQNKETDEKEDKRSTEKTSEKFNILLIESIDEMLSC